MKKQISTSLIIICSIVLISISACRRTEISPTGNCPGTPVGSWKVDGTSYLAGGSFVSYIPTSGFTITMAACVPQGTSDRSVSFEIFHDLQVGTYPLRWKMLHASRSNGTGGGDYLITGGQSYFTDSIANTGSLSVTTVNTSAKTFSGTFQFTAATDDGTGIVHITDGTFSNIKY